MIPLLAVALMGGAAAGLTGLASAATSTTDTTNSTGTAAASAVTGTDTRPAFDIHLGGHIGKNGVKEVVLTGNLATKATNAALAAYPGATIDRVENDADGGGVYEAHMTKADGSRITVLFDANMNITSTETGGPGGHGGHGGRGGHGGGSGPDMGTAPTAPSTQTAE